MHAVKPYVSPCQVHELLSDFGARLGSSRMLTSLTVRKPEPATTGRRRRASIQARQTPMHRNRRAGKMTKTMFSKATVKSKCPRQPRTTGPNESSLRQRSGIAIAALGMIDQAEVAARLEGGRGAKTMLNLLSKIIYKSSKCLQASL